MSELSYHFWWGYLSTSAELHFRSSHLKFRFGCPDVETRSSVGQIHPRLLLLTAEDAAHKLADLRADVHLRALHVHVRSANVQVCFWSRDASPQLGTRRVHLNLWLWHVALQIDGWGAEIELSAAARSYSKIELRALERNIATLQRTYSYYFILAKIILVICFTVYKILIHCNSKQFTRLILPFENKYTT